MGHCLDPGLPRTCLQRGKEEGEEGSEAGSGQPSREIKDQLDSSRDGGRIMTDKEEPILRRDARGSAANRVKRLPIHLL
jgi:hypothetical protein